MDAETTAAVRVVTKQIRQHNRQYATTILRSVLKTVLPGVIVLLILAFLSNYVIGTIDATFGNRVYTSAASGLTLVISILAARAVWLWANRRFQGWTLIRTVGQVNSSIRQLERAVREGELTDQDYIVTATQAIWETYVTAMQTAGFPIESG
jgi:hypothetical protein